MIVSGNVFCAVLSKTDLLQDISFLVNVEKVDSFSNVDNNIVFEGMRLPIKGVCVRFTLHNPQYYITKGKVYSKRAEYIRKIIQKRSDDIVLVSRNCLEGRTLFNLIRPFFT